MQASQTQASTPNLTDSKRYAKCIEVSRRVRWDIDRDVIRGREFDLRHKFLPDGLSCIDELVFLSPSEQRFLSQVQGRTYANMFGLVERFIGAKMLEVSRDHWLGDQTALEALVRFTDEEMKLQELFRRIEGLTAARMPQGYRPGIARLPRMAWQRLVKAIERRRRGRSNAQAHRRLERLIFALRPSLVKDHPS